eukprot:49670_1
MSEDVAGATLMAAGSSAPELFTALIGVWFYANENPGPSTNCASAAFNMCVIIGCSIFFCGYQGLAIRAYPFIRDCTFYALAVIELYLFWEVISPGEIAWGESLALVLSWVSYIVVLIYNNNVIKVCVNVMEWMGLSNAEEMLYEQLKCSRKRHHSSGSLLNTSDYSDDYDENDSSIEYQKIVKQAPVHALPQEDTTSGGYGTRHIIPMEMEDMDTETMTQEMQRQKKGRSLLKVFKEAPPNSGDITPSDTEHPQLQPQQQLEHVHASALHRCGVYFNHMMYPFHLLFKYSIPRTNSESSTPILSCAFVLVLVWLAILTFICVDSAEKMGNCLAISEDVMGLTLLAIGSSLPDCFSSVLAAKQGKGEMAVSNALGSNVFDINICIGVSFLLKSIMSGFKPIIVERDEGFELFIAALFVLLAIFMVAMFCYGLVLNKTVGAGLMVAYAIFLGAFCYLLQYD